MNILEIQKKIDSCSDLKWVHPSQIEGFDASQELQNKKIKWNLSPEEEGEESSTSIVEYYLSSCINEGKINNKLPATPMEILDAAFYLMTKAGSTEVAFSWPIYRSIFPETQAEEVMDYIQSSFENIEDSLPRYLIAEFALDFYEYGPMWKKLEEKKNSEILKKISSELDERRAFSTYINAVGDSKNIGSLFHQNKMTDSFIDFLGKLYAERQVLQRKLEENPFESN